jgi:DNA-binding SARP family transcriptional activator/TolB-like protein
MVERADEEAPAVRIAVLGPPLIARGGTGEPLRLGRKTLALLAYLLAYPGQEHGREKLAALLWPDRFEEQARGSLRQALSELRRALGELGESIRGSSDGRVSLDSSLIASDLAELERLHRADDLDSLAAAAALHRGPFLEQLGSVSEEFDAWALQERERRRAQAVGALERLVEKLMAAGRIEEARERAERLVEVDPGHEPGHRALMSAYAALGQRAAALRQFEACERALKQLLDAEPDAETRALAQSIRGAGHAEARPLEAAASRAPAPHAAQGAPPWRLSMLRALHRRRLLIGGVLAGLLVATLWAARPPGQGAGQAGLVDAGASCLAQAGAVASEPALLVLPLRTFGEDPSLALFAGATTERVQSALALLPGVAVIAGPPAGHPDLALSLPQIAERNSSTHVLDGGVRARSGEIQISLRLIDARTSRQLWQSTTRLPAPLADPVSAQDEVALAAAAGVQERLTDGRQALVYRRYEPATVAVWESITRGTAYLNALDPAANDRARAEFATALAIDPQSAGANAGIAFSHLEPVLFRWTADAAASVAAAKAHAEAALAVDPEHAGALSASSLVALLEGDHARAVALGEQSLSLGGGGDAAGFLAYVLSYTDDTARSVELARQAVRSRPYRSPLWYEWNLARALRLNGDLDAAIGCLSGITADYPTAATPALELALAYGAAGEPEQAHALADVVLGQTSGRFSSAAYCALPPYADEAKTAACVAGLTAAGLP